MGHWKPIDRLDDEHPEFRDGRPVLFGVLSCDGDPPDNAARTALRPFVGRWSTRASDWVLDWPAQSSDPRVADQLICPLYFAVTQPLPEG